MVVHEINEEILQDVICICTNLYYPLDGFMSSVDYKLVVNEMTLSNGTVWTLPITLDVNQATFLKAKKTNKLYLSHMGKGIGFVEISDCFKISTLSDLKKVYKTNNVKHPGVAMELKRSEYRVGGRVTITNNSILKNTLTPGQTKKIFTTRDWKSIVGFQTRNPIHRAHEHLQRVGLDLCDGIFINPLIGWKKKGDFTERAVMNSYKCMIEKYYPEQRVHLSGLKTYMRYAGPREAIFHAIIRRNLGCTHFIIGRDHAGVGDFYGIYEAHDLAIKIIDEYDLGINLLLLNEPFFCEICDQIVSSKHCGHDKTYKISVSGTKMRETLRKNKRPDSRFMRPEVIDILLSLKNKMFL